MKHRGGVLIASGYRLASGEDPPPDPPGDTVSPPLSIDPLGVTNVSAELQAWINAQADGSTFDFTGRIYRTDQQLNLWSRTDLDLVGGTFLTDDPTGDGSTYAAPSSAARSRSFWDLRACTNITVTGMTLEGPHTAGGTYVTLLEAQMGFNILGSTNVDIGFCNISNVYGDFVYWGLGVTGLWNDDVHVHDCICDGNGRQGFALVAARNCSMVNNTLTRMARAFVDMEPNGATLFGCDNILIEGNTVDFHNLAFIASGGVGPVDNITVRNNTGTGLCNLSSIVRGSAGSRRNWIFDGNTSVSPQSSGGGYFLECNEMVNVTVTNNVQPVDSGPMALAYFDHCTGVINQGNTVVGGTWTLLNDSSTYIRDCGNRFTASGPFDQPIACVTDFGTPKQYAGLTAWYDAFQATDADLAAVSSMTDFSGNARHLVSSGAARPTFRTSISGKNKRCYQFDGVDDYVGNTIPLSNFITSSAFTIFVVFEAVTIGSAADNDAVWSDSAAVHGIYMRSVPDAYAFNVDSGGGDTVTKPLTLNDRTLLMMRHEGGNLYLSKDGGAETSVASGNTTTLAGLVRVGANYLGNQFSNILVHEINVYNVALTTAQILDRTNRLILDWGVDYHYGAVDTFTRANGLLGTSEAGGKVWLNARPSTITEWQVVSGKAVCTVGDPVSGENITYLDAGLSDYTMTVEVDGTKGGTLCFRYANAPNFCIFAAGGDGYLFRVTDGSWFQVGGTVSGLPTGGTRTLKVVLLGSSVKTYVDTTLVHDATITHQQTATKCGLRCPTEAVFVGQTYDNFLVVP